MTEEEKKAAELKAQSTANDGAKKKIAGKWDTIEEAVEQGYVGLEKGYHELSEGLSKLTRVMEQALSTPTAPIGTRGNADDPYGRGRQTDEDDIDPAKFLTNPREVLDRRDAKLAKTIVTTVVDLMGNMNAVNQFKVDNPDLVKHEKLVKAFMNDTDRTKTTAERLTDAGKAARDYLKSLKVDLNAGKRTPAPGSDEYVEPPTQGGPRLPVPTKEEDAEGEASLVEYINDRNKAMAEHFGAVENK